MTLSTWIGEFCECTHPLNAPVGDKLFVTLIAYMDDSGTHEGSHNSLVAGYWGGVGEWSRFEYEWKEILRSEGLEGHGFHAKEFWPRIPPDGKRLPPYSDWSDQRHQGFIDKLLNIIETSRVVPFAIGVNHADWNKQPEKYRRIFGHSCKHPAKSPAVMAFQLCVARIARYCKAGKRMHFFCSKDPQNYQAMSDAYDDLVEDALNDGDPLADALGPLLPEKPKIVVQLQAADLIAYEAHLYAKRADGDKNAPLRNEYLRALRNFRAYEEFHPL